MAWHIFEKLLEQVANHSKFAGKVWITFLFIFRLIIIASIGDTVYSDEQSAFKCNTLQPGCENVCFSHFSPISQIRFWAVQILFVGTPSVIFIVYTTHKLSTIPPLTDHKRKETSSVENEDEVPTRNEIRKRSVMRDELHNENLASSTNQHLPKYEEIIYDERNLQSYKQPHGMPLKNNGADHSKLGSSKNQEGVSFLKDNFASKKNDAKKMEDNHLKEDLKPPTLKVKRKRIYRHEDTTELVKTPEIARAYAAQALARTLIESGFLYLQYRMFKFEVREMYLCEGFPCPRVVECFVSRPMEKTIFLRFMYAMTILSLLLNIIELYLIVSKWIRRNARKLCSDKPSSSHSDISEDFLQVREIVVRRSREGRVGLPVFHSTYPALGPFPRSHDGSFGNSSDGGTIDSDYRFYDT